MSIWERITANPKSTATAILMFVVATCQVLKAQAVLSANATAIVNVIAALGVSYLQLVSFDPGTASAAKAQAMAVKKEAAAPKE
jgi:hypothetical protein